MEVATGPLLLLLTVPACGPFMLLFVTPPVCWVGTAGVKPTRLGLLAAQGHPKTFSRQNQISTSTGSCL